MNRAVAILCLALPLGLCGSIGAANAGPVVPQVTDEGQSIGTASWYGQREAGRRTDSGALFNPSLKTAAHRFLPLGSCVQVTHLGNGRFLTVPITDRGPYIAGRLIDLSQAAARALGMERTGLAQVRIKSVTCPHSWGEIAASAVVTARAW